MNKKYFLWIFILLATLLIPSVSANHRWHNLNNGYKAVIETDKLNLKIKKADNWYLASWNKFTAWDFKYYKLVYSYDNPKPAYPDDWYIAYIPDSNLTKKHLEKLKSGYYRVCTITNDRNRYCSNVVKLKNQDIPLKYRKKEEKKKIYLRPVTKKRDFKRKYTNHIDEKINLLAKKFIAKMERKYKNIDIRIQKIEKIIKALESLASRKPKYKKVIEKLNIKLRNYISENNNWFSEIEKILNEE